MVYIYDPPEIKLMGATARPLTPVVNAVGPTEEEPVNASTQEGNILFLGLEPGMAPASGDRTYERGHSNYVKVTIAQGELDYFTSRLQGRARYQTPTTTSSSFQIPSPVKRNSSTGLSGTPTHRGLYLPAWWARQER
jgi:hypothetical protein